MPRRITYWTGTWDPRQEAISKEIELLRSLGGGRHPVVSVSPGQGCGIDPSARVLRFSARRQWVFRAIAPAIERHGDITHVFGGLDSWHLLRAVGRRPVVLTAALGGAPASRRIWTHVSRFVAESEPVADELAQHGVPRERIRIVYPGVDLHEYRPGAPPGPFRILFASSPADATEFDARGIPLLVETARACPQVEVVLLWREWGDRAAAQRALRRLAAPANVVVETADGRDMPSIYRSSHAVACLYAPGFGKSCPNSVIEALACGVPALVSDTVGIARIVSAGGAGFAVPRDVRAVAEAVASLRRHHGRMAAAARRLAERAFDVRVFLEEYVRLYAAVAGERRADRAA